jgi:heme/copper-type cytochrome/quinol oxidase subunit 3
MAEANPNALDVSHLPDSAFDARSPLWWGNLLAILIETTTIALMLATYFYVKRNFDQWPPPKADPMPSMIDPLPDLPPGTWLTVLLVASCLLMYLTDLAARKQRRGGVIVGLIVMTLIGAAALWLRFKEFPATRFSWGDNAYASVVWTLLILHLTYLLAGVLEFFIMGLWVILHPLDEKHALDVTLAGGYWYWTAGIWLPVYFTIYWVPRLT